MAKMRSCRFAALALAATLTACATVPPPVPTGEGLTHGIAPQMIATASPIQCVPFAREKSGIQLRGNANEWWTKAAGQYRRSIEPKPGAVLVLKGYQTNARGHLAVVRSVRNPRTIIVDHANWLNQGEIQLSTPVVDVSDKNDWSEVRVWHTPSRRLGQRVYSVEGFIHPDPAMADAAKGRSHSAALVPGR